MSGVRTGRLRRGQRAVTRNGCRDRARYHQGEHDLPGPGVCLLEQAGIGGIAEVARLYRRGAGAAVSRRPLNAAPTSAVVVATAPSVALTNAAGGSAAMVFAGGTASTTGAASGSSGALACTVLSAAEEAAHAAFEAFPRLQMIAATTRETHGVSDYSLGATLFTRASGRQVEPIELPGVVDRIGGGDAFAAGFLFAHMTGMKEAETLAFALHAAAAKHGQVGDASHASAADVLALLSGGGLDVKR